MAMTLASAAWIFRVASQEAGQGEGSSLPSTQVSADSLRFRGDAWFLPDEELLGFVEVPAGPFLMGSDPDLDPLAFGNEHWADTGGRASVDVPTFYIGRYETTVAQFRAFVEETGYRGDPAAAAGRGDQPVSAVSWTDALSYARWMDAQLRASPDVPAQLVRVLGEGWQITLPTEVQWEKAARGSDGRIYPWGDEPRPDRANFMSGGVEPVGNRPCPECPYGLADMAGNVWEWTRTPFEATPYDLEAAPRDLREDALWVMRGGSFADQAQNVRTAVRGGADPGARRPFIGFRLAISPP